jgi:putative DNA primase/helicase
LHENGFEFKPTHKIWLATNHKPTIRGTDVGIWSRVRLIPFTVSFEGRENKHLKDALQHELPGILNWVLEGCANWRLHGLNVPRSVSEANDEYRSECDQLKRFLDERCIIGDYCTVGAHDLYLEYKRWANETGEEVPSEVKFADRMRERGFKKERTMARLLYLNVGLTLHKTGPISDAD